MDRKVCIFLVILVLAVLAGPGAKAAALDSGTGSIDAGAAVRQLMWASHSSSMKLDDGVAPELAVASVGDLEVHRRFLAGTPISPGALKLESGIAPELAVVDLELQVHRRVLAEGGLNVLDASRQRCIKTCHPDGQPYTRGCKNIYGCPGT